MGRTGSLFLRKTPDQPPQGHEGHLLLVLPGPQGTQGFLIRMADGHRLTVAARHRLQTGQLSAIAHRLIEPLVDDADIAVHIENLRPQRAFPFPWPFFRFLDAFPESALMTPGHLAPLGVPAEAPFDLVILCYQVWFLAPSQPVAAFLLGDEGARLLRNKPVVTVVACRNMWMMAHDRVRARLAEAGSGTARAARTPPAPVAPPASTPARGYRPRLPSRRVGAPARR